MGMAGVKLIRSVEFVDLFIIFSMYLHEVSRLLYDFDCAIIRIALVQIYIMLV